VALVDVPERRVLQLVQHITRPLAPIGTTQTDQDRDSPNGGDYGKYDIHGLVPRLTLMPCINGLMALAPKKNPVA